MLLKPSTILLLCLLIYSYSSNAQQAKKLQLELTGSIDFALIEGYPLWGVGSHAKLLFSVGQKSDAIVATLGIDRLYEDFNYDAYSYTFALTSIGYRKNIKSFFIEPKAGFGINMEDGDENFCGFIGIEPGIQKRKFTFSIDYRFISSDGLAYGDHFHTFAIRMGYKIPGK
jgi:hypothetical protein